MGKGNALAQRSMREELASLWQTCFEEPSEAVDYFFDVYFEPENCVVCQVGGQVVAMAHLLPAQIVGERGLVNAHYIYAAATLPAYRSKGYMAELLAYAAEVGEERGDHFSFLLPSNQSLYRYYSRFGYVPYFKMRFVTLTREDFQSVSTGEIKNFKANKGELTVARNNHIISHPGSVVWSERAISYAVGLNELYGGSIICSGTADLSAYALCCFNEEKSEVEVIELMANESSIAHLATNILHFAPALTYRLRLPSFSNLFENQGEVSHFGMMKSLGINPTPISSITSMAPYLGLTLD